MSTRIYWSEMLGHLVCRAIDGRKSFHFHSLSLSLTRVEFTLWSRTNEFVKTTVTHQIKTKINCRPQMQIAKQNDRKTINCSRTKIRSFIFEWKKKYFFFLNNSLASWSQLTDGYSERQRPFYTKIVVRLFVHMKHTCSPSRAHTFCLFRLYRFSMTWIGLV